uniref:Uncharacterized protein n=1 Tax=Bactrocera dorsalis TaxID=27457 RepID=A0A034VQB3_BACDO
MQLQIFAILAAVAAVAAANGGILQNPCTQSGYFAFIDNMPTFYSCSLNDDGSYAIQYLSCSNGYVFSQSAGNCVLKDQANADDTTVSSTSTTEVPSTSTTAATSTTRGEPVTTGEPSTSEVPIVSSTQDVPVYTTLNTTEKPITTTVQLSTSEVISTTIEEPRSTYESTSTDKPDTTVNSNILMDLLWLQEKQH